MNALKVHSVAGALFAIAGVCACAGSDGAGIAGRGSRNTVVNARAFPSAEEVKKLSSTPPPPVASTPEFAPPQHTLLGPFPDVVGASPVGATGADPLVKFASGRPNLKVTEQLSCAAREMASVIVKSGLVPSAPLTAHMLGRCGNTVRSASRQTLTWDDVTETDAAFFARAKPELATLVDGYAGREMGVALARDGKKVVALVVAARPAITMQPQPQRPKDGVFAVQGTMNASGSVLEGYVNQGRYEAARCDKDPAVALPAFSLRCPVLADDETAWISLYTYPSDRVLGHEAAAILVVNGPAQAYAPMPYVAERPLPDAATFAPALLAVINEVRAQAKRAPLTLVNEQSTVADSVTAHYFGESKDGEDDQDRRELVALGLMAGHEVKNASICDADFHSFSSSEKNLATVIADVMAYPGARRTVMNPNSSAFASGALRTADQTHFLLLTYEFVPNRAPEKSRNRVTNHIIDARKKRGVGGIGEVPVDAAIARATERLTRGEEGGAVLNGFLQDTVDVMNYSFRGWVMESNNLDELDLPAELLSSNQTYIAVAVAPQRFPGQTWARWVVLIVAYTDTSKQAA